jgi:hypothetical protein
MDVINLETWFELPLRQVPFVDRTVKNHVPPPGMVSVVVRAAMSPVVVDGEPEVAPHCTSYWVTHGEALAVQSRRTCADSNGLTHVAVRPVGAAGVVPRAVVVPVDEAAHFASAGAAGQVMANSPSRATTMRRRNTGATHPPDQALDDRAPVSVIVNVCDLQVSKAPAVMWVTSV